MKTYWEVEVQLHTFLTLAPVSFMLWMLYSCGKSPWYPLDRRVGGCQS